jgi:hypothetical protein
MGIGERVRVSPILNVGGRKAVTQVRWKQDAFVERGKFYDKWGLENSLDFPRYCDNEA